MKRQIIFITFLFLAVFVNAQTKYNYYNPDADAQKEINAAVKKASKSDKHVMLIIGGNWCPWCVKLSKFIEEDAELAEAIGKDFELVKVNYSKENKNEAILKDLEYPQRFGFPVIVFLNEKGERIHTQNSVYIEEGKGYNKVEIIKVLGNWSYLAVHPVK